MCFTWNFLKMKTNPFHYQQRPEIPKNGDWSNCKVDHWNFLGQKSCWGDLRLLSLHNRKSILQSKESKESKETLKSKESGCSYEFLHWNRAARFILRSVSYFFRKCAFCVISDSIMCHKMCHIFLLQVVSYLIVKCLLRVLNICNLFQISSKRSKLNLIRLSWDHDLLVTSWKR